ncbi:acyl-CoA thioesterase [Acinetobacter bereziniae]|uniref:acyl-CoA thioesterase n=1 Tax=Acinetobacter bereziniae TaxID=106648 RepID=UPI00124FBD1B|nr:acyl-CoA thioesterase [Acinetobacter bereziniae]MDA3441815.1 acyl-CoA thioesterase [Acinetobacter bereziniae]
MKRLQKKIQSPLSNWTTDQDCYLIENSVLPIESLVHHLPFTEEEIRKRKETLGLVRRQRQMMKAIQ